MLKENARFLRKLWKVKWSETTVVLGFPRSTWGNYETGASRPVLADLKRICHLFGISEDDFLNTDLSQHLNLVRNKDRPGEAADTRSDTERIADILKRQWNNRVSEPEAEYGDARDSNVQFAVWETLQSTIRSQEALIRSQQDIINSLQQALSLAFEEIGTLKKKQ